MKIILLEQSRWILFPLILCLGGCANVEKDSREVFFESMIFKNCSNLKEFLSSDRLSFCNNFTVCLKYPQKDVFDNYNNFLKQQGWVRTDVDKFTGEWESYIGPGFDNQGAFCIYQLLSVWKQGDGKLEVFVRLVYYSKLNTNGFCNITPDNDLQYVQAQMLSLDKNGKVEVFK